MLKKYAELGCSLNATFDIYKKSIKNKQTIRDWANNRSEIFNCIGRNKYKIYKQAHNVVSSELDDIIVQRIQDMNECSFPVNYKEIKEYALKMAGSIGGLDTFKVSYDLYDALLKRNNFTRRSVSHKVELPLCPHLLSKSFEI